MGGVIILENQRARGRDVKDVRAHDECSGRDWPAREKVLVQTFRRRERSAPSYLRGVPALSFFFNFPPVTARPMGYTIVGGLGDLDPLAGLVLA